MLRWSGPSDAGAHELVSAVIASRGQARYTTGTKSPDGRFTPIRERLPPGYRFFQVVVGKHESSRG